MKKVLSTKFDGEKIDIYQTEYTDSSIAIVSYTDEGEPYCDISTNLGDGKESDRYNIWVKKNSTDFNLAMLMTEKNLLTPVEEFKNSGFNQYQKFNLNL